MASGERGPYGVVQRRDVQLHRPVPPPLGPSGPGPRPGPSIKAYRGDPLTRSIFPRIAQEKPSTMKLVIVLFAVVAAVSAYPGVIPWAEPVAVKSSGWQPSYQASSGWQPSGGHQQYSGWQPSAYIAPQPKYIKIAAPAVHAQVKYQVHHAPQVHQVYQIPQPVPIPPVHPQPLNLKVHSQAVRIPLGHVKVPYPHLIGIEAHVPEPEIKVVKSHHPW